MREMFEASLANHKRRKGEPKNIYDSQFTPCTRANYVVTQQLRTIVPVQQSDSDFQPRLKNLHRNGYPCAGPLHWRVYIYTADWHEFPSTVPVSAHVSKFHFPNLMSNSFRARTVSSGSLPIPQHQPKAMSIIRAGQRLIDR